MAPRPPTRDQDTKAPRKANEATFLTPTEKVTMGLGACILFTLLPFVGTVVATAVLWDFLDRGCTGRPLDGVLMTFASWVNRATHDFNKQFVKHEADSYLLNAVVLLAIFIPGLWGFCLYSTITYGFSAYLCYVYHVIRIGPYFMNFAYVYTLCHKEGHSRIGLFKQPYGRVLNNVFNWWIGLFYGVLPASFAYGHSINHHRYNNGPSDVVSTSDKPRDSFYNFLCYLPRWTGYAINLTTTLQFFRENNSRVAVKMITGSLYWFLFAYAVYLINPTFAFWYLVFPLGENILLLACVNWCWHAFLNPNDPEDEYVGSITIFDGPINVLNEDFHVVHHQYPGAHWTNHPKLYDKHFQLKEYSKHVATVFKETHAFELFFLIILRKYDIMAEKFVLLEGTLTIDEKKALIKERLVSYTIITAICIYNIYIYTYIYILHRL
ncbi:hypothetical protein AAMO2058_000832600 [Amorphochlora amoebiformis]